MRTFVSGPFKVVWWYNSAYLTSFSFKPVSVSLLQFSWGIQSRKLIFIAVKIKIPSNPACTPYTFNALKTIWILVSLDHLVSTAVSIQRSCDFYKRSAWLWCYNIRELSQGSVFFWSQKNQFAWGGKGIWAQGTESNSRICRSVFYLRGSFE